MVNPIIWPLALCPEAIEVNPVPFSRSGGRTLGGQQRSTRTDLGDWSIIYRRVPLYGAERRRWWNALRVDAGGMAGLLAVPAWSLDVAPWPVGSVNGYWRVPHSDDTPHSDGTPYEQTSISVLLASAAAIGDTSMTLRIVTGIDAVHGIRFSYQHALYETGFARAGAVEGTWVVRVFPAVRAAIPADAVLECARPTCLVRLADDRAMDVALTAGSFDRVDVAFIEATDEFNDRAVAA